MIMLTWQKRRFWRRKDFCIRVKGNCRANRSGWVFLLSLDPHQSCKRYNWGDKMHQDLKQHVMMRVMMEHIYSHYSLELNSGEFWSFILLQKGGIVMICSVYHRTRDTTERTKCCIWWWNPIPYFKGSFSGLIASFSWQHRAHFESCLEKWNRTFRVFLKPFTCS